MRLTVCAVGRMRDANERALADMYLTRAKAQGRGLGITDISLAEIEPKPTADAEAQAILSALPPGTHIIALDERGKACTSRDFAGRLEQLKDTGTRDAALVIGGADGHGAALREAAHETLSLGAMTWPHMLARIMVMEQIYRAVSIMAGHPYHRD